MRILAHTLLTATVVVFLAGAVFAQTGPAPRPEKILGILFEVSLEKGIIAVQVPSPDPTVAPRMMKIQVTDTTKIVKLRPVKLGALCKGDRLAILLVPATDSAIPKAAIIEVQPETMSGLIDAVNPLKMLLLVRTSPTGPSILFRVVQETRITKNGQPATLRRLERGDLVKVAFFHFADGNVAVIVAAMSPKRPT